MGFLSTAKAKAEFGMGVLELRPLVKVGNYGLVISTHSDKYQPDQGVRYEISPDEWLYYTWEFFPKDYLDEEDCRRSPIADNIYFDVHAEYSPVSRLRKRTGMWVYAVFREGHTTGYLLEESYGGHFYGLHINRSGIRRFVPESLLNLFTDATDRRAAATYMMSNLDRFQEEVIDLSKLETDCADYPGHCYLRDEMQRILSKCSDARNKVKGI